MELKNQAVRMLTSETPGSLPQSRGSGSRSRGLSPAGRLCAFVLFAALLFAGARQVGHDLGPIGTSRARSVVVSPGRSGGMHMNMNIGARKMGLQRSGETPR
ncbi:MAG TPA: hypothetical protein VMA73_33145 [Streptosporangiaceae bacterium]|nr:hypothetical protein [Streptosporangiaceae bacterium]